MINIYKPDETNFTHNGLGSLDEAIQRPMISEKLNGLYQFTFSYPLFAKHADNLKEEYILRAPTPKGNQLFRIWKWHKKDGMVEITTYHIFYDLIDNFIEDTNIVRKSGREAIHQLMEATHYPHQFNVYSDIDKVSTVRIVRQNPVESLLDDGKANTFVSRYGGEIERNNFDIRMNKAIGKDRGFEIRHRKNLIGYEANVDFSGVVTQIMPQGFDGLFLPEKYIKSPLIDQYEQPKIRRIKYDDVKANIGQYGNDKDAIPLDEAYEKLRELAKSEFTENNVDKPIANYKINFVMLEKTEEYRHFKRLQEIYIGDTVTFIHEDDGISIKAKLISYEWDPFKEKYTKVELGNESQVLSRSYSNIQTLTRKTEELQEEVLKTQSTANGKNTIYRGSTPPKSPNPGDFFVDENSGKVTQWNGVTWKPVFDISPLRKELEEAQKLLEGVDGKITEEVINQARLNGVIYETPSGELKSIIAIADGVPYIKGEHIILDGDTIVGGDFKVTQTMFADGAVLNELKAKGAEIANLVSSYIDVGSISAGDIDLSKGFRITNNGDTVLGINAQTGRIYFNAPDYLATKDDLKKIESMPGPKGEPGRPGQDGKDGKSGRLGRNLLIGSNEPVSTTNYRIQRIPLAETPKADEELTLTVKLREPLKDYGRWLKAYHGGNSIELAELKQTDKDQNIYTATFPWKNEQEVNGVSFTADEPFLWLYSGPNQSSNPEVHFEWAVLARGDVSAFDWYASDEEIMQLTRDNQNQIQEMGDEVGEIYKAFQDYKKILDDEDATRTEIERAVENMRQRIELIDVNLGEFSRRTDFVNNYILEADEGLFVGERGTKTGILIGTDRISFQDNGREVASISQQLLTINRALLVESLEVHPYKFEPINDGQYGVWSWLGQEVENGNN